MKPLIAAALLALAACGPKPAAQTKTAAAPIPCTGLPAYAPLYPGGKITLCTQGEAAPGKIGGAVGFTSPDAPPAILAFYRGKAAANGMPGIDGDVAMVFRADDGPRVMRIQVLPEANGGSSAILTWEAAKPS